ncbi:MAG TPA: hypothetical protein DDY31_18930 [Lachnospiraceae bacterium]|nr:hypothetical protein [Lachnospiraceae bacterium]
MFLLSDQLMDALFALQTKEPQFAYAGVNFSMAASCRDTCSGSCEGSCSGDCENSCSGSCEESCSGDCDGSCHSDCESYDY